tara:strand:+ start:5795 stop:5968 length:174 start_codon:yes stop_codon:yes gene_type:complete
VTRASLPGLRVTTKNNHDTIKGKHDMKEIILDIIGCVCLFGGFYIALVAVPILGAVQ